MNFFSDEKFDRRVLVVDDDEGDCCLVEDILAEDGIQVVKAVGGEAGIRALSEEFPVVITDLKMPDIDGFGIIDFIGKRYRDTVVIVISGYASIDNVIEALRRGAYDYIMKPFGTEILRHTVKRAFDYIGLSQTRMRLNSCEMVSRMADTAAHEIFQPLTVLMGHVREIEKSSQEPVIREEAMLAMEEIRRIKEIVTKIEKLKADVTRQFPGGHTIIDIHGEGKPE